MLALLARLVDLDLVRDFKNFVQGIRLVLAIPKGEHSGDRLPGECFFRRVKHIRNRESAPASRMEFL